MFPHLIQRLRRLKRRICNKSQSTRFPDFVRVGEKCSIDPTVQFREHEKQTISIAEGALIRRHCELCGDVTIGKGTRLNRDVYLRPHTHLGERLSIGPFVRFITDSHEISDGGRRAGRVFYDPIHVGDGVWIGAGAIILGGVTIGRGAVVAAGAVVTRDVEPDTIVAGTPARKIRELPRLKDVADAEGASCQVRLIAPEPGPEQPPRPMRPAA